MADVEYITTPGPGLLPGSDNLPGWDNKAPDTTIVHAHDGGAWEEITDEETKRIARAASKQASTIRTVVSSIGGVSYFYKGDYDPPMRGNGPGDAAFALDDNDNVIRLYRWTGTAWVRHELDNAVLANLDVGKLTAGSASISNVVAKHIWSGIVTSKAVEAEQITGDMIAANSFTATSGHIQSLDAGVITAGLLDADRIAGRSITAAHLQLGTITGESGILKNLNASDITAGVLSADRIDASTLRGKLIEGAVIRGGRVEGAEVIAVNQRYPEYSVALTNMGLEFRRDGRRTMVIGGGSLGIQLPISPDKEVYQDGRFVNCYRVLYGPREVSLGEDEFVWTNSKTGYIKKRSLYLGNDVTQGEPGHLLLSVNLSRRSGHGNSTPILSRLWIARFDSPGTVISFVGTVNLWPQQDYTSTLLLAVRNGNLGGNNPMALCASYIENGKPNNSKNDVNVYVDEIIYIPCSHKAGL